MLIAGIIFGVILLAAILIWLHSKRKKSIEEKFQATRKLREDSLKEALVDSAKTEYDVPSSPHRPYKVEYSTGEGQNTKEKLPLLQVIEKNKLSEKKYIFRASEKVILGVQFGTVTVLNSLENAESWCEIFFQNGIYCVRSSGAGSVYVRRNKKTAIVDEIGLKMNSEDVIMFQDAIFQVHYIKN